MILDDFININLPSSLEELEILNKNESYYQDLNFKNLPVSLKRITVHPSYKGDILLEKNNSDINKIYFSDGYLVLEKIE